jgi:hypothetical protein
MLNHVCVTSVAKPRRMWLCSLAFNDLDVPKCTLSANCFSENVVFHLAGEIWLMAAKAEANLAEWKQQEVRKSQRALNNMTPNMTTWNPPKTPELN